MSLPSDNENSKKIEKSISDHDSSGDESTRQDRKRKQGEPNSQPKPTGELNDTMTSPEASKTAKTTQNETEAKDTELKAEDSGSSKEDVFEVRDDIEHLNLDEPKAKDIDTRNLQPTEQLGDNAGRLILQPNIAVSGTPATNENVPTPALQTLQVHRLYKVLQDEPIDSSREYSCEQGSDSLPTDSNAMLKRKAFAKKAEDTLDDVSEITSDISDLQTDSTSSGKQALIDLPQQRRISSGNELSESSASEYKTVKSVIQDAKDVSDSLPEENVDLDSFSKPEKDLSEYKTAEDAISGKECDNMEEKKPDEHANTTQGPYQIADEDDSKSSNNAEHNAGSTSNILDQDMDYDSNNPGTSNKSDPEISNEVNFDPDSLEEQVSEDAVEPPIQLESVDESVGQENIEPLNADIVDDQVDANEQMEEQEESGEQDISEHDNSSSNLENFGDGEFARFPVDASVTSTSDSGIENSDAVFIRDDRPNLLQQHEVAAALQERSETTSSLPVSGLAGLNDLQQWVGSGARVGAPEVIPEVSSSDQSGQLNDEVADQPISSSDNSQQDWPPEREVVYLARQQELDEPMEYVENFDSDEVPPITQPNILNKSSEYVENFDSEGVPPKTQSNILSIKLESRSRKDLESGKKIDVENGNVREDSNKGHEKSSLTSLDPKTSLRLARDDYDQASSSSLERSCDSSLADMDDAIESSDSRSREESNEQLVSKIAGTDKVVLELPPKTISKIKLERKPSPKKRRAKTSAETKSKSKKRKDLNVPCRHQAEENIDFDGQQSSDSDEEPNV